MPLSLSSKERVARCLARQPQDRIPMFDWFWAETEAEFVRQIGDPNLWCGIHDAKTAAHHKRTLWEYFDFDLIQVAWPDQRLRLIEPVVLEQSDEWVLLRDGNDAELRWWKHKMGTPEHVRFGIDTPEKWAAVKPLLTASRERIRWDEFWPRYRRSKEAGKFICFSGVEIIESVKDTLGHEMMCKAMLKRPEWLRDVFETYTQFEIDMFHLAEAEGMVCDGAFIYGDIAYKNGPFMSPKHYREFVFPCHKRFFDEFHQRGMPVVLHSDGDIRKLLPHFIDADVDMINPMESRAGMDVRELAPQFGDRLGFCGNIDVMVLATNDREKIAAELHSKVNAAMQYHGYMYHSDHSIPPGVTLETYRWLLDEVRPNWELREECAGVNDAVISVLWTCEADDFDFEGFLQLHTFSPGVHTRRRGDAVGRRRGKIVHPGLACQVYSKQTEDGDGANQSVDRFLTDNAPALRELLSNGARSSLDFLFGIHVRRDAACTIRFSPELLRKIADLGVSVETTACLVSDAAE